MPVPWPISDSDNPRPDFSETKLIKIEEPKNRAMSLRQLRQLASYCQRLCKAGLLKYPVGDFHGRDGKRVKWTQLTQHEICNLIVKKIIPVTNSCSWVEVVCGGKPQQRNFFCSHNWGECFRDFMVSIEAHAKDQGISAEANYWICVYANNQHNVVLGRTLEESPFYSALKDSEATLLMLDKTAEALLRIWCVFELNETLITLKQPLQIWTPLGRVGSGLVSSGPVVQALHRIDTRQAQASNDVDQRQILNHIAEVDEVEGIKVLATSKELDQGEERLKKDIYENNLKTERKDKFEKLNKAVISNVSEYLTKQSVPADDGQHQGRKTAVGGKQAIDVNLYCPGGGGTKPTKPRCWIGDGCMRGITLQQLRDFHQKMKLDFEQNPQGLPVKKELRYYDTADMYVVDKLYMEPYRAAAGCSYVEIVAEKAARPEYHVIYGSGMTFKAFMAALEWHAEARQLPDSTAFFIVPFMLDPDEADRPEETRWTKLNPPTEKVIQEHVVGQIMLIDDKATVLKRCIPAWEAYKGINKGLTFDLAAASGALATTSPFANRAWEFGDVDAELAMKALAFDVAETEGNKEAKDRSRKLGDIAAGKTLQEEDIPTSQENNNFARLNMRLREKVAGPVLREAGYTGNVSLIHKVLKACPSIMFSNDLLAGTMGERAVHTASSCGHLEVLNMLLDLKSKPDVRDAMGETPLHYAAMTGKTEVVKLLLASDADPETQSYDSETPLEVARLNPAYYMDINTEGVVEVLQAAVKTKKQEHLKMLKEVLTQPEEGLKDFVLSKRKTKTQQTMQRALEKAKSRSMLNLSDGVEVPSQEVAGLREEKSAMEVEIARLRQELAEAKKATEHAAEVERLKQQLASQKQDFQTEIRQLKSELESAKQATSFSRSLDEILPPEHPTEAWPDNLRVKQAFSNSGIRRLNRQEMHELLSKVTKLDEKAINTLVEAAHTAMVQQATNKEMDCEWFLNWLYPQTMQGS